MKFFFFDTETTGTDPKVDRIIQFGYIFGEYDFKNDKFNEIRRTLQNIYIDEDIPLGASKVHGIYKEDLDGCGYFGDYVDDFLFYFKSADYIVGHNIEFDKNMFYSECKRLNIKLDNQFKFLDTMKPTTELVNGKGGKWPKLMDLHKFLFGYGFENAHDAMSDITATKNCFFKLLKSYNIYDNIKPNKSIDNILVGDLEKRKGNEEAIKFIKLVKEGSKSIFLTGNAGTGKSTLIRDLINTYKDSKYPPIVLGSTGLSAINIGGQTLHSFFALGKENVYYKDIKLFLKDRGNLLFRMKKKNIELLKKTPLIVVDEISMISSITLDCMDYLMRHYLGFDDTSCRFLPFGGKQIILIGDIYQLPPVANENRNIKFGKYYSSEWFFDSESYEKGDFKIIQLKKIYRQKDHKLVEILNDIRDNKIKEKDIKLLNDCAYNNLVDDPILLTTHKDKASNVNQSILQKIPGNEIYFHGSISGKYHEKMMPVNKDLAFKIGAKVMLMTNIEVIDRSRQVKKLANGSIGIIEGYESNNGVEWLKVNFDGTVANIQKHIWENNEYTIQDDKVISETVGEYEQIPLQLAYAITIHKSQGLTFKECKIDLTDAFAGGQGYTALSRVESLKGLKLLGKIDKASLFYDTRIQYFNEKFLEGKKNLDNKIMEKDEGNKNTLKDINPVSLEKLKEIRTNLSKKFGVPGLAIFSNQILEKFITYKPKSLEDMYQIPGIKSDKVEKYGSYFIDVINSN